MNRTVITSALLALLLGSCDLVERKVIGDEVDGASDTSGAEGGSGGGSGGGDATASSTSGGGDSDGGAQACGELPPGVEPIRDSRIAVVSGTGGMLSLRVSSDGSLSPPAACFYSPSQGGLEGDCPNGWMFELVLDIPVAVGTYDLSMIAMSELSGSRTGRMCDTEGGGGNPNLSGTLQILSVDETCVTGVLEGFVFDMPWLEEFVTDGGFVASRCDKGSGGSTDGYHGSCDVDLQPAEPDASGEYEYGCACESCDLMYRNVKRLPDIDAFVEQCECICQEAGCGSAVGGGGETGGNGTGTSSGGTSG